MVRLRRIGLVVFAAIFIVLVGGGFLTEGIGLAAIAAVACLVVLAMVVPFLAVFEEERDLPAADAARRGLYRPRQER
jgi:hypothetical protein